MRNQRTLVNSPTSEVYEGGEMRRRIADCRERLRRNRAARRISERATPHADDFDFTAEVPETAPVFAASVDWKSTRLNSSHDQISYAVFCLKKKKKRETHDATVLHAPKALRRP